MYQAQFLATDDAQWARAVSLFDDSTGDPLAEAENARFDIEVSDCGTAVLSASTDDATLTKPEDHIVQWIFTAAQMSALCTGKTYQVGLTMTVYEGTADEQVIQLLIGSLAIIDGGF